MPVDKLLRETKAKMDKSVEFVHSEFATIRTGKASPSLVENLTVDYYGTKTRMRELANISTPEPRLIAIHPWDPGSVGAIIKAIEQSNLGITPISDGKNIRVPIPELNEERRKDLTKLVKKMAEEGKVAIRNIRRSANEEIKTLRKNGTVPEDDSFREENEVQKLTDEHIAKIDELLKSKEEEIMEV
jgi:ribosome recycling factor